MSRLLAPRDLLALGVIAVCNASLLPALALPGPLIVVLWPLIFAGFLWPQARAVIVLSARFPKAGGVYHWTREVFGDAHGFIAGWCYWLNNVFYIPTLLYFIVASAVEVGRPFGGPEINAGTMLLMSTTLLWCITIANVRGLGTTRMFSYIGGVGTIIVIVALTGLALAQGTLRSMSAWSSVDVSWSGLSVIGVMCLSLVGLELGPTMRDDIAKPDRAISWSVPRAAVICAVLYFVGSIVLVASFSGSAHGPGDIVVAIREIAGPLPLIVPVTALILIASSFGSASAWFSGSARLLFAVGLDDLLPPIVGRLHPRFDTPVAALVGQAVVCTLVMIASAAGGSTGEAYLVLLSITVVLQLVPFLYLHAACIADASLAARRTSLAGFLVSAVAMCFAVIPAEEVANKWLFSIKVCVGCLLSLAVGLGCSRASFRIAAKSAYTRGV